MHLVLYGNRILMCCPQNSYLPLKSDWSCGFSTDAPSRTVPNRGSCRILTKSKWAHHLVNIAPTAITWLVDYDIRRVIAWFLNGSSHRAHDVADKCRVGTNSVYFQFHFLRTVQHSKVLLCCIMNKKLSDISWFWNEITWKSLFLSIN